MTRTVGTLVVAVACALLAVTTAGPPRLAAGLLLCLYLPGRLAVAAIFPPESEPEPVLRVTLVAALSLGTTMLVGFATAAAGHGFPRGAAPAGMFAACLVAGAVALVRRSRARSGWTLRWPARWRPRPRWGWLAAVPAVVLGVVLVVQLHGYRAAGPWYTELAVVGESGSGATVVVHSRERHTTGFRCETRAGGALVATTRFSLAPGEQREFTVSRPGGDRVEVRLYRADDRTPYRYLVI